MTSSPAPRPIASSAQLDEVLAAPLALVYKHSNRCPISAAAMQEVQALLEDRPDAPVWIVDVNTQRALSREIADKCLQYWGGNGFMWENPAGQAWRDGRLASIGGGADEIMLRILAKGLGYGSKRKAG